jgi:hypothetical protein
MIKYDLPKFLMFVVIFISTVIYFIVRDKVLSTTDIIALVILILLIIIYPITRRKSVESENGNTD